MKEIPKRLAPTTETLRALFAKSGNSCAFPGCTHPLIDEDNNFIANVCHIEDAMPGGRFNEDMTNEKRRSYDNLILFCYRHHIHTNNVEKFPVSRLVEIKKLHESTAKQTFTVDEVTLLNIFNELKSVKEDTTIIKEDTTIIKIENSKILELVQKIDAKISGKPIDINHQENDFSREIESILKLRDTKNQIAAIQLLEDLKNKKWNILTGTEKYKLTANIGVCYLDINNIDIAANYFIESLTYDSENIKALGFAALGYAIKEKIEEATSAINKVIEIDPKNVNAYVSLLHIDRDKLEFSEVLSRIPTELKDSTEIAYALGGLAKYKGDYDTAISWFQNAVDNSPKNKGDLKATLASAILESVTNPFQVFTGQVDSNSRNRINYCIQLLTESWEEFKDSELRVSRVWHLVNRGIAKKYLSDSHGAFEDIKLAASIADKDYNTVKHLAIAALEVRKYDFALDTLERLKSIKPEESNKEVDLELFKAEILSKKKDYANSIPIILEVLKNSRQQNVIEEGQSLLIYAYLSNNETDKAKELSLKIIKEQPNLIRGYIDASRVLVSLNDPETAAKYIEDAYQKLSEDSGPEDIQALAFEFVNLKDFPRAIELLEKITNKDLYTDLSKNLLKLYYSAGETQKALSLCQSLRANHGPIDLVTEMQSTIYDSIGDLPKAIEICEDYLQIYPDDQRIQIRLAILYAKIKDEEKVRSILSKLINLANLPLSALYQLAFLNLSYEEFARGLEIAFSTRRKFIDESDAHLKYIGLISEFPAINEYLGSNETVIVNTAVKLKEETGQINSYYIVSESKGLTIDELSFKDPLAKAILGSRLGETVEVSKSFGEPQKFEIVGILSKYIYAYQESIHLLNTRFVDVEGFRVFSTSQTGDIKKDFKYIFDSLDEKEKHDNQIYEFYNNKVLPIGTWAQIKGINPIKLWSTVFGNPMLGIYSISSNHSEIQSGLIHLDKGGGIVLDLVSILTLASIKKLDLLEKLPITKAIAWSSKQTIENLITELKGAGSEGFLMMNKINGQYVKTEITKEQIEKNRTHYEELIKWVENHCDIFPCNEALAMNSATKDQYDQTLGIPFIDSILIAKENKYYLLAEEESLRSVANNEFQVKGFPSYALISYLLRNKNIDQDTFDEIITNLILMCYKTLPINSGILIKCVDIAEFSFKHPYDLALMTLDYSISSEDSSVQVSSDFIYKLYMRPLLPQVRTNLIVPLLSTLIKGRNVSVVIQKLIILINIKFRLLQPQKDEVHSIIREYLKSI